MTGIPFETMKSAPKTGTTGEMTFDVEAKHCIEFATDGMPLC